MSGKRPHVEWIALILAIGISTALNVITLAVVWTAIAGSSDVPGGLSENATQILTGWGGGMIGVIGAYVGYQIGANGQKPTPVTEGEPPATYESRPG